MRVALYGRFSSDQQNAKSADDQLALCRQHAERQGWTVVASFKDEAVSGASVIGRFGLENMLKAARANQFDLILVEAIDRLSRDQGDIGTIRKSLKFWGIGLHTLADGKVNSITAGIRGLLAETFLEELAAKTRRGLAAVTKDGRHAGGRSYGYRPVVGRPGELEIVPEQAEVVREIFEMVARGTMPRVIATTLNARGVPGPRGAAWNASTIYGSRTRANGILNNSLYIGEIVWNRQTFVKDPDTGRRVSRPNGDGDRIVTPAPHLRIVSDELWAAVAGRKRNKTPQTARLQAPRHMFSGLIKCHVCGSSYIVAGSDRERGPRIACTAVRERGTCTNRRTWSLRKIETHIIDGLRRRLARPEVVAEYLREFTRQRNELAAQESSRRNALEGEIADVRAKIKRFVRLIEDGVGGREMAARILELEARADELDGMLRAEPAPIPSIHPNAVQVYQRQLETVHAALAEADEEDRQELFAAVRALLIRATVVPDESGAGFYIDIEGDLKRLLQFSDDVSGGGSNGCGGPQQADPPRHAVTFRVRSNG
jgi:DNA invertase Pin-like site-specific DNA recombinase